MATISSADAVDVRPREQLDIPILSEILTRVYTLSKYPVDGPQSFPARFSSSKTMIAWVATTEDRVAGHIEIALPSSFNQLCEDKLAAKDELSSFVAVSTFFVDPEMRGKGIGARLFREVLGWAKEERKRLALVVLDKDEAAIRMYERMQWVREGEYFYESIQGVKYHASLYIAPE